MTKGTFVELDNRTITYLEAHPFLPKLHGEYNGTEIALFSIDLNKVDGTNITK